jgi:hypothetical protein
VGRGNTQELLNPRAVEINSKMSVAEVRIVILIALLITNIITMNIEKMSMSVAELGAILLILIINDDYDDDDDEIRISPRAVSNAQSLAHALQINTNSQSVLYQISISITIRSTRS